MTLRMILAMTLRMRSTKPHKRAYLSLKCNDLSPCGWRMVGVPSSLAQLIATSNSIKALSITRDPNSYPNIDTDTNVQALRGAI